MRESSSVRLIWSFGSGPSPGGAAACRQASCRSWRSWPRARRVWPRARPARARIALSPALRSSRAPLRAWPNASRATPALRELTGRRGHRPRPPPRRAPKGPPPRLSVVPRACTRAPKTARCDGWRWRGSSSHRGRSCQSSARPSRAQAAAPGRTAPRSP